jgi:hypothetical protein
MASCARGDDHCEATGRNAYSLDLRLEVLNVVERGIPREEVVRGEDLRPLDARPGEASEANE